MAFFLILAATATPMRHSGNVWSRYMTIESIVDRGTLDVTRSTIRAFSGSPDLVMFHQRLYSDKPPVLPAMGAVVYWPLSISGLKFSDGRAIPRIDYVLVLALIATSSALAIYGVRALLVAAGMRGWLACLGALSCGVGTLLWTYGVTFNNHSVAAGLITLAFALRFARADESGASSSWSGWAGFFAGLAATIDLPAGGLMLGALAVEALIRSRREFAWFVAGAVAPLVLHTALQSRITGTPLPVEFYPEAFEYPGSYWTTPEGRFVETGPRWRFGLELLLGPQGWLTVTPLLAIGLVGLSVTTVRGTGRDRRAALVVLGVVVGLLGYYTFGVRRTDFAGQSYGVRHLLPITPLVFTAALITLWRLPRWAGIALFLVLWPIGLVYAYEGQRQPWSRIERRTEPALVALQRLVIFPESSYRR